MSLQVLDSTGMAASQCFACCTLCLQCCLAATSPALQFVPLLLMMLRCSHNVKVVCIMGISAAPADERRVA
jgi:hypothetical protein